MSGDRADSAGGLLAVVDVRDISYAQVYGHARVSIQVELGTHPYPFSVRSGTNAAVERAGAPREGRE
jgi:hypothetical protein